MGTLRRLWTVATTEPEPAQVPAWDSLTGALDHLSDRDTPDSEREGTKAFIDSMLATRTIEAMRDASAKTEQYSAALVLATVGLTIATVGLVIATVVLIVVSA